MCIYEVYSTVANVIKLFTAVIKSLLALVKIIEKYAASGVITTVESLQYWPQTSQLSLTIVIKNINMF